MLEHGLAAEQAPPRTVIVGAGGFVGGAIARKLEGRGAAVSYDVPADPDALDRRHGGGHGGAVLAEAREAAHLRDVAGRTGYRLHFEGPGSARPSSGDLASLLARLEDPTLAIVDARSSEEYQGIKSPSARHGHK